MTQVVLIRSDAAWGSHGQDGPRQRSLRKILKEVE